MPLADLRRGSAAVSCCALVNGMKISAEPSLHATGAFQHYTTANISLREEQARPRPNTGNQAADAHPSQPENRQVPPRILIPYPPRVVKNNVTSLARRARSDQSHQESHWPT